MLRGDPDAWAIQVLYIICLGLRSGEDTPALPHGVDSLHSHNRRSAMGANLWSLETDRCQ